MVPTIGRRMYFHAVNPAKYGLSTLDITQPFDAGVIFVHGESTVNLQVTDHTGVTKNFHHVEVVQDSHTRPLHDDYWVEWMPYQKEQAAKEELKANHDIKAQAAAWVQVTKTLDKLDSNWLANGATAVEAACKSIEILGEAGQAIEDLASAIKS